MRGWLGLQIRRVGYLLVRLGDWIEGGEAFVIPIDLEPEHALKALQDAAEKRREDRRTTT